MIYSAHAGDTPEPKDRIQYDPISGKYTVQSTANVIYIIFNNTSFYFL